MHGKFRNRFNNYKACSCKFYGGSSELPQADFSSLSSDRLNGNGKQYDSFWQYKLRCLCAPGSKY